MTFQEAMMSCPQLYYLQACNKTKIVFTNTVKPMQI